MSFLPGKALYFTVLFFFSLGAAPLSSAPISLSAHVGFNGIFHLGQPFPLRVEVQNSGPPLQGSLEIRVWKGGARKGSDPYPLTYRREIFLSSQARKSVLFTVDPDFVSRPLQIHFSGSGGKLSKEIDLRSHFSPSPLAILVTESNFPPSISFAADSPNVLVSLSLSELPADARAYLGISTILFYEQSLRELAKSQALALESWLALGGRLIVLGSLHYALYQEPSWSRFLPVRVRGLKRIPSLAGLERTYKEKIPASAYWAQDVAVVDGRLILEERGTPILVERRRGRGKLLYLSLDLGRPPFSDWAGLPLFFRDLLGSMPEGRYIAEPGWDESIFNRLLLSPAFISSYVPVRSFLLGVLFFLGGLGLWVWLWQQGWPKRQLLFCLVSFIPLSSLAGYLYFAQGGRATDAVLFSSTLLDSLLDGHAEAHSNVALFSTQRGDYKLHLESGWTDLEPLLSHAETDDGAIVIQEDGFSTSLRFHLKEWHYRLFKIRSIVSFPLLTELKTEGERVSLKVANLASKDLLECALIISGQHFSLGDIPQGSRREFHFSRGQPQQDGSNRKALLELTPGDKMREILFRASFFPQDRDREAWMDSSAVLLGWIGGAPRRFRAAGGHVSTQDYSLFRAIIPLAEEGEE